MLSSALTRARRCRASPFELVLLGVTSFLGVLIMLQGSLRGGPLSRKVRAEFGKLPVRPAAPGTAPGSCPPGFYSPEALRPHLKRPVQDPGSPGADGRPFPPAQLSGPQLREKLDGMARNDFNQFASDRISLHRGLGSDTRPPECVKRVFPRCPPLPTTSVIIVFHNEAWSALLRTVYSVLHTAPAVLLTEILLVDDASTADHLKGPLEEHVRGLEVVRVIRQPERKGLIQARLLGARQARGQTLTFLDAHCECFPGWLEPLLARIGEDRTVAVSPAIPIIQQDTLEFSRPAADRQSFIRGSFDWSLNFSWEPIPEHQRRARKDETFPIKTPAFAGGLYSISKSYFNQIGTYDDKMEIWGGENVEMSFRVWLCGGRLEIIPCSVVGHIYRRKSPHTFPNGTDVIIRNQVRLAEVWMDEYKELFYRRNKVAGAIARGNKFGDISQRLRLRESLHCRNFSWYLENVCPEVYVPDLIPLMYGMIRNVGSKTCLDVGQDNPAGKPLIVFACHSMGGNQYFEYTSRKELRHNIRKQLCLRSAPDQEPVRVQECQLQGPGTTVSPAEVWEFAQTHLLRNPSTGSCLSLIGKQVVMDACNPAEPFQQWAFL
ncbi:polypeptide N-acetylgalactosaminyltransferase 6-like [Conger conger]|uniref:polypeptide N-acetylgalactosaminyltransferase 6-like n=1 Tax=Conger conger TaxID=82655 RepID=UPI002A5A6DA3|nr:polypeptide N-acetylgalactosaminyltransferase 6-like [Conger conger]XP_061075770.1 polypeptide N-acetylgalactosaminyltransferase 6-like [Conger conger]XP_061075771.1 polypeptide N-acetylgalactosaminyltransferase 6-like [Conger conger]